MPVSIPPTNTTPETAYVLNGHLPLDATVDITGLANPQKIWFRYNISSVYDFAWSAYASGLFLEPGLGYLPQVEFRFNDPLSAPFQDSNSSNGAVEAFIEESIGVAKTGTLYISFHNGYSGYTAPAPITVYIKVSANAALPAGSILVNNDIADHPMSLLSPTGEPTQVRSFPASECAAILENGISLWTDNGDQTQYHLYDEDLVLITDITWDHGDSDFSPVSSDRQHTFYIATRFLTPGKITTISDTGVLGSTEWTITNLTYTYVNFNHIAPSFIDDDIIFVSVSFNPYVAGYYGIAKFHKSTGVIDSIFVDSDDPDYNWDGFYGSEFLVLPNDSSLLMFRSYDETGSKVKLFNSSGVLVREFNIFDADINHIAYHADTYDSFWVWSFKYADFSSNFVHFRISDGVELANFTVPTTTSGAGFTEPEDPYSNMWGVPECCPFITTTTELPPYGPPATPPGIVVIVEGKRTDIDEAIPTPTFRTGLLP